MSTDVQLIETLQWQFRMTWSLAAEHHLPRLDDAACLWMPHPTASTVRRPDGGRWIADWHEPDDGEPWHTSVAWLTWHLQWWLTSALAEARGEVLPNREDVEWPGTAGGIRAELERLAAEWKQVLVEVEAETWDLDRDTRFPWPDPRPLHRLLGWVNIELMKNVAEIGVVLNLALRATG